MRDPTVYDAFLSYNSADRQAVEHIARLLRAQGLTVWLDTSDIPPGTRWDTELQPVIETCRAAVVCIGPSGPGHWQEIEIRACLEQNASRGLRVIPVLLPGVGAEPKLPFLLKYTGSQYLDCRGGLDNPEALNRLVWGITGRKTEQGCQQARPQRRPAAVLPEAPPFFVGRQGEMERAIAVLRQMRPFVICGMPGIGKSRAALQIARRAARRNWFAGGVRWCDIGGEVDLEQAIQAIAGELGVSDIGKARADRRLPLLASQVAEQHMLLILDNVLNQQVSAAIVHRFQNAAVLLTTRHTFSGHLIDVREQVCHLGELTQRDAARLLLEVSGEDHASVPETVRQQAIELCDLVGCHPYAIRVLGSTRSNEGISFDTLRRELREILEEDALETAAPSRQGITLNQMFQTAYERLGNRQPGGQAALRAVSLFAASFSTEAVQALLDCPSPRAARKRLVGPLRWSLVQQLGPERYRLHDLLREFGQARLAEAGEQSPLRDRYVSYYGEFIRHVDDDDSAALVTESHNVLRAFQFACQSSKPGAAVSLADGLTVHLKKVGSLRLLRRLWKECVALCRSSGSSSLPHALLELSRSMRHLAEPIKAQALAQEALNAARAQADAVTEAHCLYLLATLRINRQGKLAEIRAMAEDGLRKAREHGDRRTAGLCLHRIAWVLLREGKGQEAVLRFDEALEYCRASGVTDEIAHVLTGLADALKVLDRLDEATEAIEEALILTRRTGDRYTEALCLFRLGSILDARGRFAEALPLYEQSRGLREEMGATDHVGTCLHAMGHCKAQLGHPKEAEALFKKSLAIKRRLQNPRGMAPSLEWLARLAARRGDLEQAIRYARQSLELYESVQSHQAEEVRGLVAKWTRGQTRHDQHTGGGVPRRER